MANDQTPARAPTSDVGRRVVEDPYDFEGACLPVMIGMIAVFVIILMAV